MGTQLSTKRRKRFRYLFMVNYQFSMAATGFMLRQWTEEENQKLLLPSRTKELAVNLLIMVEADFSNIFKNIGSLWYGMRRSRFDSVKTYLRSTHQHSSSKIRVYLNVDFSHIVQKQFGSMGINGENMEEANTLDEEKYYCVIIFQKNIRQVAPLVPACQWILLCYFKRNRSSSKSLKHIFFRRENSVEFSHLFFKLQEGTWRLCREK